MSGQWNDTLDIQIPVTNWSSQSLAEKHKNNPLFLTTFCLEEKMAFWWEKAYQLSFTQTGVT